METANTTSAERAKYRRAWSAAEYRAACHGLALWRGRRGLFPLTFGSALDIGCGTGRLLADWNAAGIDAWGVDIADNALDPEIAERWGARVVTACLWEMEWDRVFDFGVCTDVMEHIPPEHVRETLRRIGACCREVLFKIAHSPNQLGGEVLHLTLHPWQWWVREMEAVGGAAEYLGVEVRSGCHDSLIRWRPAPLLVEPLCDGRRCVVVGSAPGSRLPDPLPGDVVIGANGGAALASAAGRIVDALATTSHLFRAGRTEAEEATVDSLRGRKIGSVWIDTKCGPSAPAVEELGLSIGYVQDVSPEERDTVTRAAAGVTAWVSTGVWAACLAVASGAAHVLVCGVSGQSRDHGAADSGVLAALVESGRVEVLR